MRILITGGSGMIGRHLIPLLQAAGHSVTNITRTPRTPIDLSWEAAWPEVDAAIHLCGARVIDKRWTPEYIKELYDSRVGTAQQLKAKLTASCKTIITASGANCYPLGDGRTGTGPIYDESGPMGTHESGKLCQAWENVWSNIDKSVRVAALRIGFVIAHDDSGIQTMKPIYKMCLGGVIGSGRQRFSWIALEDLLAVITRTLSDPTLQGPINVVAPQPATFAEFNEAFALAVHRPAIWWIPGWVMRMVYGQIADELMLADYPTKPAKLISAGFAYKYTSLKTALVDALN